MSNDRPRTRWFVAVASLVIGAVLAANAGATDTSKGPKYANHLAAHSTATGSGVKVGVIEPAGNSFSDPGNAAATSQSRLGIRASNNLGTRLKGQYDFSGLLPQSAVPGEGTAPLVNGGAEHTTLVSDTIAGATSGNFVGVAKNADIYMTGFNNHNAFKASMKFMHVTKGVGVFNYSGGVGTHNNDSTDVGSQRARFLDWMINTEDIVFVKSAGNRGTIDGKITEPGQFYNGIIVGATDATGVKRANFSSYLTSSETDGAKNTRGKPDILAPGTNIGDGKSYGDVRDSNGTAFRQDGTSFAAPHVTGTAALIVERMKATGKGGLPGPANRNHLVVRSIILNSARKRHIVQPENTEQTSLDFDGTDASDDNYLATSGGLQTINTAGAPGKTANWTPANWSQAGGKFTTTSPLDDEQGVGLLDANRALKQFEGGEKNPGNIDPIGWARDATFFNQPADATRYPLDFEVKKGDFITTTLVWDRVMNEIEGATNMPGVIDNTDTYSLKELANLDLRILDKNNAVIAESVSTTDNLEHLHFPFPADGAAGDYKIDVLNTSNSLLTSFGLAWWTGTSVPVPEPGSLVLVVVTVGCVMSRRRRAA